MELIFETFKDHMTLLKIKILIYTTMALYTVHWHRYQTCAIS